MSENSVEEILQQADAALHAGNNDQAQVLFQQVLDQEPNSASAHYALGTIYFHKADYQQALMSLQRAAEIEPEAVDIAINFAGCLAHVGNKIGALIQLQRASKYCRDDPVFCSRIADMSLQLNEPAVAISMLDRLQKLLPQDQIIMAKAEGALGNWRDAVAILSRLFDVTPNDSSIARELSVAAANLRQYTLAISSYERYLKNVNPTAQDYLRFADLLLIAQQESRCEIALKQAKDLGEDSAEWEVLYARVCRLKGDYDETQQALSRAINLQPNQGQAWLMRAELADEENAAQYKEELSTIVEHANFSALRPHLQALNYYSLAELNEKSGNIKQASEALLAANDIQTAWFASNGVEYFADKTEQEYSSKKKRFTAEIFDQADASISKNANRPSPIFIVGLPRSGTTLVERILGENQNVYSGGELEALEFVAIDLERKIKTEKLPPLEEFDVKLWTELRQQYFSKLPEFSEPIFTDKMPHNFRHVGLILKLFPEARVLQMHRAMQDVCLSIYSHAFPNGHSYATSWDNLFDYYRQSESLMQYWGSLNSPRVLDVQYENLVQKPEYYAKQIVEFCGFDWQDSYLEFHKSANASFTFSELQVRQPISDKRVRRWEKFADFIPALQA